ncbi:MAG: hypothetical protein U0835_24625 [Isosphaeraceae bacterium]
MRARPGAASPIRVSDGRGRPWTFGPGPMSPAGGRLVIETDHFSAAIITEGYVSGVAAGSFLDKATGARDLGFGLSIVDFLLEPVDPKAPVPKGQYDFGNLVHGKLAKRYVEGPQICTQARKLQVRVGRGDGFVAVRQSYRWNVPYPPRDHAGSVWEQTLIFPEGERFFLSADRVTSASESPELFFRVDMPGHIKHKAGAGFEHVYLSYNDPPVLPSSEFTHDFAPDERFLYRRDDRAIPTRFIRGYQVAPPPGRKEGPWLAGMTLHAADVYQAWCHQRGYVCLIEELGGRAIRPGDTFGACYLVGWFDGVDAMERAYDRFKGASGLAVEGPDDRPTGYRTLAARELTPLRG